MGVGVEKVINNNSSETMQSLGHQEGNEAETRKAVNDEDNKSCVYLCARMCACARVPTHVILISQNTETYILQKKVSLPLF